MRGTSIIRNNPEQTLYEFDHLFVPHAEPQKGTTIQLRSGRHFTTSIRRYPARTLIISKYFAFICKITKEILLPIEADAV